MSYLRFIVTDLFEVSTDLSGHYVLLEVYMFKCRINLLLSYLFVSFY